MMLMNDNSLYDTRVANMNYLLLKGKVVVDDNYNVLLIYIYNQDVRGFVTVIESEIDCRGDFERIIGRNDLTQCWENTHKIGKL